MSKRIKITRLYPKIIKQGAIQGTIQRRKHILEAEHKQIKEHKEENGKLKEERTENVKNQVILYVDKLLYSPLDLPHYLEKTLKRSVTLTKTPKKATVIASSYLLILKKYLHLNKKYLLWTHEPYHDWTYTPTLTILGKEIHIMNVYTGNIFCNNHRYFCYRTPIPLLTADNFTDFKDPNHTVVAFSTLYPDSYYSKNKYTILPKRYEIIKWGHTNRALKVWGKGFDEISEGNTRDNRSEEKAKVLAHYDFNLALENTEFPHYVTEKIWESIINGCLPIYWSNCTIYGDFPQDSFIDYRKFSGPEDLFAYIKNMTVEEFRDRMNRCILTFNKLLVETSNQTFYPCPKNKNLEGVNYSQCYGYFINKLHNI